MTYETIYNTGVGLGSDKAMMYEAFKLLEEYKDIQDVLFLSAESYLDIGEYIPDIFIAGVGVERLYHHPRWGYMVNNDKYSIVNDVQDMIVLDKGIATDEEVKEELTKLTQPSALLLHTLSYGLRKIHNKYFWPS